MNTQFDEDTDYSSLEQARKYYELIANIKTSVGKLDMLQLYISSKYSDDVVLINSVNNIIAELNKSLGENNYKTIEIQTNIKSETYRYFNVPMSECNNMLNAKSIGRYVQ